METDEMIREKVPEGSLWRWRRQGAEEGKTVRVVSAWIDPRDKLGYVDTEDPTAPEYDRRSTRYRHRYVDFTAETTRVEGARPLPVVGTRWVWEVDKPHARALVEVTEVRLQSDKADWWVRTKILLPARHEEKEGLEHWSELDRFYEACSPVGAPVVLFKPSLKDEYGDDLGVVQEVARTDKGVYFTALIKDGVPSMGYFGPGDLGPNNNVCRDFCIDPGLQAAARVLSPGDDDVTIGEIRRDAGIDTLGDAAERRAQHTLADDVLGDLVWLLNGYPEAMRFLGPVTMKAARDYALDKSMTTNMRWMMPEQYEKYRGEHRDG